MCGSKPPPVKEPPPPVPQRDNDIAARSDSIQRQRAAAGYGSYMSTMGAGSGGTSGDSGFSPVKTNLGV